MPTNWLARRQPPRQLWLQMSQTTPKAALAQPQQVHLNHEQAQGLTHRLREIFMRSSILRCLALGLAATLTTSYAASDDQKKEPPLNYNDFITNLEAVFNTPSGSVTLPSLGPVNTTSAPTATAASITDADITINTAPYSGQSVTAGYGMAAMVNCAYGALLSPVSKISAADHQDSARTQLMACGISEDAAENIATATPLNSGSMAEKANAAMEIIRQAYQYKLIIEKCSRDVTAASGTTASSSPSDSGTCSGTITNTQSTSDAAMNQCTEAMLRTYHATIQTWLNETVHPITLATSSFASTESTESNSPACDTDIDLTCMGDYSETPVDASSDGGTDLVSDAATLLTSCNNIISDGKAYVGYLLAGALSEAAAAATFPGMLSYDNLGTSECLSDTTILTRTNASADVAGLLAATSAIATTTSASAPIVEAVPMPKNMILANSTVKNPSENEELPVFVSLDTTNKASDHNKTYFKKNVSNIVTNILSYRHDRLASINTSRNNISASFHCFAFPQVVIAADMCGAFDRTSCCIAFQDVCTIFRHASIWCPLS